MPWVEEEGRTKEEAIEKALKRIGVPVRNPQIELVHESKGIFGFIGSRMVKVRVSYEIEPEASRLTEARQVLERILKEMGIDCTIEAFDRRETFYLNIISEREGLLIGRRGETIDALQYLVNRIVNKHPKEQVNVILDIENYRDRREEKLRRLAQRLASQVKMTGEPLTVPPMNAHDRRIIHITLQDDQDVKTMSTGNGSYRKVVISLRGDSDPVEEVMSDE